MKYQVIIIGGGPSGLMAAIELQKHGINYLLLEKNNNVASKLFISGGKRCNVTNNLDIDDFIDNLTLRNKRFLYPSLYTFSPSDVIAFFKRNNLGLVLENNFKYFPETNKSQSIIDVLLNNIDKTKLRTNTTVKSVVKEATIYKIKTSKMEYQSENVIIATGSKSFPLTGSTGFGIELAKSLDISYQDFIPAETHIYSNQIKKNYNDLMGTSISQTTVKIKNTKIKYTGDLLFTHFGLSGPVIYHLSEFIYEESLTEKVTLEFPLSNASEDDFTQALKDSNATILKILEQHVSKRLARKILEVCKVENKRTSEISKKQLETIRNMLFRFEVEVTRVEDREKAYVNKGGISLKEINPNSLESKKIKGLYFTGETLNIHGPIGGYNITIAFATGKLAALSISEEYKN